MRPPAFAGGTATGRGAVRRRVRNRKRLRVRRRAPRRARRRGAAERPAGVPDFRAFRLGFPRRDSWHAENADARRDRRRLPGRCPRGQSRLRRAPARGNGGEKRARGRVGERSPRPSSRSGPSRAPRRCSRGRRRVLGRLGRNKGVQTKIPSSRGGPPASPVRRARPVASTSPSPRASPTPRRRLGRLRVRRAAPELRAEISRHFRRRALANRTRLATCLHSPSHELLAVTERGNVLCLSPGLRGFDAEASESQASENEKQKTHSTRHVGRLRGGDFVASADFEARNPRDGPRVARARRGSRRSTFTRSSRVDRFCTSPTNRGRTTPPRLKKRRHARREKSAIFRRCRLGITI